MKTVPIFKNEEQEAQFWAKHDFTNYYDIKKAIVNPSLPNLKPSTKTITIRVTEALLSDLKMIAHKKDVPYQSLMKMYLDEKIKEEQTVK